MKNKMNKIFALVLFSSVMFAQDVEEVVEENVADENIEEVVTTGSRIASLRD